MYGPFVGTSDKNFSAIVGILGVIQTKERKEKPFLKHHYWTLKPKR